MTKEELLKKNVQLEKELHVANNSIEYWQEECKAYQKLYWDLESKVNDDLVFNFLTKCSITQKQDLENFIKTL